MPTRYVTCTKNRKIVYGKSVLDLCRKLALAEDTLNDGDVYDISGWGTDSNLQIKYDAKRDTFLRYYPVQLIPEHWAPVQGCKKITSEPDRPRYH